MYSVIALETEIRMHKISVIVLTDAVSLSLLQKKNTNNRLLKISIFWGIFEEKISIHYINGPHLFFADLISRQFNLVHLENDPGKISQDWPQLLPLGQIQILMQKQT